MHITFIIILTSLLRIVSTYGQTCCSAGAPLNSLLRVNSNSNDTFSLNIGYEFKSINLLIDNGDRLTNDPRSRYGQSATLKFDYILNDKWSFSTLLPLIHQSRSTVSSTESSLGLGDLTVISQYTLLNNEKLSLSVAGGVELPTGSTSHTGASHILLSPDMQSGSGSFDFITNLYLIKYHVLVPFLNLNLEALYRNNGVNEKFAATSNFNGRIFGFGDEFNLTLSANYQLIKSSGFYIPDLGIKYRWASNNIENNTEAPNSGGNWISLPMGMAYQGNSNNLIRLYTEIPLYQQLTGLQITTNFTIGLQFKYAFGSQ